MEGLLKERAKTVCQLPWREQGVDDSRYREFNRCGGGRLLPLNLLSELRGDGMDGE